MKIAFDYQIFSYQRYGGVSRYVVELARHLAMIQGCGVRIGAFLHVNAYLLQASPGLVLGWATGDYSWAKRLRPRINFGLSRLWMAKCKPDIVHETYYSERSIGPTTSKVVITVHDMIHEKFRENFPEMDRECRRKYKALQRADHIICVSENTRRDLLELTDVMPEQVSVVHHGYILPEAGHDESSVKIDTPFLLFVGTRTRYKNFHGLLKAYALARRVNQEFSLVCFGGGSFTTTERELMKAVGLDSARVVAIKGTDSMLRTLYEKAAALVYPSIYEGFGMPTLEAMALDCPVLCSDRSSIPEVVGQAGRYFNPEDIESMTDVLEDVLFSEAAQEALIEAGRKRIKDFSWNRCAAETKTVYDLLG